MIRFPNAKNQFGVAYRSPSSRWLSQYRDSILSHSVARCFWRLFQRRNRRRKLSLSGMVIDGDPQNNLVMKAWRRLSHRFSLPPISIYLHKAIPFGAGLGGGSSDAAFLLAMVRDYFRLPLSDDELDKEAASLGADCPFFLHNKPLLAKGIGDEFEPIELSLKSYRIVLVKPSVSVPTSVAYSLVTPVLPEESVRIPFPVRSRSGEVD